MILHSFLHIPEMSPATDLHKRQLKLAKQASWDCEYLFLRTKPRIIFADETVKIGIVHLKYSKYKSKPYSSPNVPQWPLLAISLNSSINYHGCFPGINISDMNHMNPRERKAALLRQKQDLEKKEAGLKVMAGKYQLQKKIGQGVSSIVFSAINIHTGERVAIKKIKNFLENKYESLRILREILLLRKLKHPNIINLREIVIEDEKGKELSLILDYIPTDAKKLFKSNTLFDYLKIKLIIFQILLGLNYCQQSQVLHRDLKPQNILITDDLNQVKLCDFGLARAVELQVEKEEEVVTEMKNEEEEKQMKVEKPAVNLTAHVATRWYRAPELILLQRKYSNAIDIWSVGCILGELMTMTNVFTERKPLFPGKACYPLSPPKSSDMNYKKINDFPHSVYDQLSIIFSTIGTPTDIDFISDERARNYIKSFGVRERKPFSQLFRFITPEVDDFLQRSLEFNPNRRMTIAEAINHKLFDDIRHLFELNLSIKGEPITMDLDGIEIEQIREMVLEEYRYYQQQQ